MGSIHYQFHLIYQASAPAALLTDVVAVVDSDTFSENPEPTLRTTYHVGDSQPMVEEVPAIGSGWFDDAPPVVFPQPEFFPSQTASDLFALVVDSEPFTKSPGPTVRTTYHEGLTIAEVPHPAEEGGAAPDDSIQGVYFDFPIIYEGSAPTALTEVPDIGSGWFTNPPPVLLRPFIALPGEPPPDLEEPVAVQDVFSEGPYLLLRRPFLEGASESQLADVPPIGSGWFTNPPPVVLRPVYFVSVGEPTVQDVPDIGSGWYTNPPVIVFRPGYFPSTTELPFDIPGVGLDLCPPLTADLVHTGQSMAIEITMGILRVVEVPSIIAGFAFLVHQGNLEAEEITDGILKAEEC